MNKKFFRNLLIGGLVITLESGCLVSIPFSDPMDDSPLIAIPGTAGFITGIALTAAGVPAGPIVLGISVLLDENNPGKITALNPLPISSEVSSKLGVTNEDIEIYNDSIDSEVKNLETYFSNTAAAIKNNTTNVDVLAKENGFENRNEMINFFKQDKISNSQIEKLAQIHNVSSNVMKIYLQTRLSIKVR